jgi:hypothetical protein
MRGRGEHRQGRKTTFSAEVCQLQLLARDFVTSSSAGGPDADALKGVLFVASRHFTDRLPYLLAVLASFPGRAYAT